MWPWTHWWSNSIYVTPEDVVTYLERSRLTLCVMILLLLTRVRCRDLSEVNLTKDSRWDVYTISTYIRQSTRASPLFLNKPYWSKAITDLLYIKLHSLVVVLQRNGCGRTSFYSWKLHGFPATIRQTERKETQETEVYVCTCVCYSKTRKPLLPLLTNKSLEIIKQN